MTMFCIAKRPLHGPRRQLDRPCALSTAHPDKAKTLSDQLACGQCRGGIAFAWQEILCLGADKANDVELY